MQDILEHNYQLLKKHAGKNHYEPLLSTLYNKQIEDKPFELEKDTKYKSQRLKVMFTMMFEIIVRRSVIRVLQQ